MPTIKPIGAIIAPQGVVHLGDSLTVSAAPGSDPITGISLKNKRTGESRDVAAGTKLDASSLPGFDAKAAVQAFTLTVVAGSLSSERELDVATDASAQAFPNPAYQYGQGREEPRPDPNVPVPIHTPGPGAWISADSMSGPQTYIDKMKVDWHLDSATITSKPIERSAVKLPDSFKSLPAETKFLQYHITATFPTYVIPGVYTASGDVEAFAPASLDLVLTQTDPADLMTLTANSK